MPAYDRAAAPYAALETTDGSPGWDLYRATCRGCLREIGVARSRGILLAGTAETPFDAVCGPSAPDAGSDGIGFLPHRCDRQAGAD